MAWIALALAYSGFVLLCITSARYRAEFRPPTSPRRTQTLCLGGWGLLALSFAASVDAQGWGIGPVLWLGALTLAGTLLALWLLPYRPRAIIPIAWAAPLIAALAWVLG